MSVGASKRLRIGDDALIAIVGRSCRLPGAPDVEALWRLLEAGRCAVSTIPADRWPLARHHHPRLKEPGRSYTWSAGVLPDVWGFDPGVFRIAPREAQQIDPQQRLLLELVFEACEEAGFAPSRLAGTQTGVYVGASALDYFNIGIHDPATADAYYVTGNAQSIIANRLSYIFDLHGPSLAVDTACSSSLVALHEARHALIRGEADCALVGGVNILASPYGFIGFSQAAMLSPTGLCRAFAAEADGYVRAEGGVVLILKTLRKAWDDGDRIHAVICDSAVNSDGRTSGISLPSERYQTELLRSVYGEGTIAPDSVAYVEAHGTGTRAGDPVEAAALGQVLGRARSRPLPIGSIKSNIGHTEPAAGLAGLLKAMLALERDLAPRSLHCDNLNPSIDFEALNLVVARKPTPLPRGDGPRFAGVSSFGFGGTNAHVVIADPPSVELRKAEAAPRLMMLSAQSEDALRALADDYARRLAAAAPDEALRIVAATGHRRERMRERLVAPGGAPRDLATALTRFAQTGQADAESIRATTVEGDGAIVFVFSGNGAQWPGMGRAVYRTNAVFREAFAEVDSHFAPLAGWSLIEELAAPSLADDLAFARVAQPLVFAIQAASVRALAAVGVRPSLTIGHSVGEVAAAEAAGVLSLPDAARVIYHRSRLQEAMENAGGMAVIFGPRQAAVELVAKIPDLAIAAHNSDHCVVVAGPFDALSQLAKGAPAYKLRARRLDLVYPFHSPLMDPVKEPLLESLAGLAPSAGAVPFLSTVAGGVLPGAAADAAYWWRNVREPVLFEEGVEAAIRSGKRVFLEIGPRPTLKIHARDVAERLDAPALVDCVLEERPAEGGADPFEAAATRLLAGGAEVGANWAFGPDPGAGVDLPAYPWRRTPYRFAETSEATGRLSLRSRHPLIGGRDNDATLEWRGVLDAELEPALADHQVRGQTILPGAAFIEMGLAVAREWAGDEAALRGFEILQPLIFAPGASREILCRVSSSTGGVEIMSRQRLSKTGYATHARGKIVQKAGPAPQAAPPAALPDGVGADEIYRQASASGLDYGSAFRQLDRAKAADSGVEVELTASNGDARYGLDPARLDSCFQGLVLLFARRRDEDGAYLPVRFGEVRLLRPGADLARASIRVRKRDDRAIVADFDVFDRYGGLAATLRGARFQAARSRGEDGLERLGLRRRWVAATRDVAGRAPRGDLRRALADAPCEATAQTSSGMLTEGWALAAAFRFARRLAKDGVVDVDALVADGQLSEAQARWARTVFAGLEQAGLLLPAGSKRRLVEKNLPRPKTVFAELAAQHPECAPELLLTAGFGATLDSFAAGEGELIAPSDGAVEAYELRSAAALAAARIVAARLDAVACSDGDGFALRVLQIGVGPAEAETLRFAAARGARVTIFESDARRLERARLGQRERREASFCGDLDALADSGFDLVVSAGGLSRLAAQPGGLARLTEKCAGGATLIAVEPAPSLFRELALGLVKGQDGRDRELCLDAPAWAEECSRVGLVRVEARLFGAGADQMVALTAEAPADARLDGPPENVALMSESADAFATALRGAIERNGGTCRFVAGTALPAAERARKFVWLAGRTDGEGAARVAARCLALRDLALALSQSDAKTKVFVVAPSADRPVAEATFGFARTVANEFPLLDVRRIEIAQPSPRAAERLATLIASSSAETDIVIDDEGVRVLRFAPLEGGADPAAAGEGLASRLEKSPEGRLDRLVWKTSARSAPKEDEIEVEIVASGLNFRDVMWALSILPDEMLEDGLAGPTLGLEFAGRVTRVGQAIDRFKIGDRVAGLCGGAFATHVSVDADHVALLPPDLPYEAAATLPVAFLTAYYSLVDCARLKRGEWVLIHGGAGGVGLAALQIAQWLGARAIVTAGSPEKRALALALGAEYAFDSRSGAFVDAVKQATGDRGVSVVLNSLAGEAMEASLGLLASFGRFVELGKRDYLANTPIGLRPFRRNLSYFGVDLDQLLLARPDISRRMFDEIEELFESGHLTPLPYAAFRHDQAVEAMRLMQQSGHTGKILIRPPRAQRAPAAPRTGRAFVVDPARTHLVTGGLGGFGLAAAEWLVDRGAGHLALVGRSGASTEAARRAVAALRGRGAQVRVASLDVTDRSAAEAFFADLARTAPPLAGVMHAAATIEDAIVANLDEARLLKVLKPKVAGAEILDDLTRGLALDYFVLFSSAATAIGQSGQAAYVAANAFLEGLARERRAAGLPALAVAWGAIADVGFLARNSALRDALAYRAGVRGLKARSALDLMAAAFSSDSGVGDDATLMIADMDWPAARRRLPVLASPTYGWQASDEVAREVPSAVAVDLREFVARLGPEQARRAVADILVDKISRVLRLPREEVSWTKPLSEIGLDSLMAVELMMSIESRFALDAPLGSSAGAFSVWDLADNLLASQLGDERAPTIAEDFAQRHFDETDLRKIAPLIAAPQRMEADSAPANGLESSAD